jgi:hypothetical protein
MLKSAIAVDEGVRAAKRRGRYVLYATFPMLIALVVFAGCTTQPNRIDGVTGLMAWLAAFGGLLALWGSTVWGTGTHWVHCYNSMCVSG